MKYIIIFAVAITFLAQQACTKVQATPEECQDPLTMAEAVVNRDMPWNHILVCQ